MACVMTMDVRYYYITNIAAASVYLSSLMLPCTFSFSYTCVMSHSVHGNDCLNQYLHSDTSRSNTHRYKRARVLQELSLPILLPFRELISKPLATATSTPLKPQLTPQRHPSMDQQPATSSLVSTETCFESMDEFVPLGPNSDDESEEEDSVNVTTNIAEEGSMGWPPGGDDNSMGEVIKSQVMGRHSISSEDGDEKISSGRLFTTITAVNIQPWAVALSHSICAPSTTELRVGFL